MSEEELEHCLLIFLPFDVKTASSIPHSLGLFPLPHNIDGRHLYIDGHHLYIDGRLLYRVEDLSPAPAQEQE